MIRAAWAGISANAGEDFVLVKGNEFAYIGQRVESQRFGITGVFTNEGTSDWVFDGNVFHDIGRISGAELHFDHGLYLHTQRSTVVNNVFYGPISGWCIQTASGFSGLIANNTFQGAPPTDEGGQIMLWSRNGSVVVSNNIFYKPRLYAITTWEFSSTSCHIDNNIVAGGASMARSGAAICTAARNRLNTDPKFVNGLAAPFDFRLRSDSPAIDAGISIPDATVDADGTRRPQGAAVDVGAFERPVRPSRPRSAPENGR